MLDRGDAQTWSAYKEDKGQTKLEGAHARDLRSRCGGTPLEGVAQTEKDCEGELDCRTQGGSNAGDGVSMSMGLDAGRGEHDGVSMSMGLDAGRGEHDHSNHRAGRDERAQDV